MTVGSSKSRLLTSRPSFVRQLRYCRASIGTPLRVDHSFGLALSDDIIAARVEDNFSFVLRKR